MLGKRPRALQRTESKSELMSDEASIELQGTEHMYEKPKPSTPVFGAPRQVIGFNPVNKDLDSGGSPRSVLEVKAFSSGTGAAIVQEKQVRSPRSPRSGLESLLSSPRPWDKKGSEGVGLAIVAALHAVEEETVKIGTVELAKGWIPNAVPTQLPPHLSPRPGRPIPIIQELQPSPRERKEPHQWRRVDYEHLGELSEASVWCCKGVRTQDNKKKPEHVSAHGAPADMEMDSRESIFSTASPASSFNENSGMLSAIDFLSSCFNCKRHLGPGKDIYIYRGDRAFCSVECRYQQIVNDEHKEKCPPSIATDDRKEVCSSVALKGASVLPSASPNHQSRGTTAAAA